MVLEIEKIKNYNYFIWDFDGTLFDTYPLMGEAFVCALDACGFKVELEEVLALMSSTFNETFNYYKNKFNLQDSFVDLYTKIRHSNGHEKYKPFPFAENILSLIVESGKENYIFTHRGESIFSILKLNSMTKYFKEIVTTDMGYSRKPCAEGVNYLIDKYSMDRSKTIYIGDRKLDIDVGKNAKISTCLIDNFNKKEYFDATFHFESLKELYQNLK